MSKKKKKNKQFLVKEIILFPADKVDFSLYAENFHRVRIYAERIPEYDDLILPCHVNS